ncbi:hypothetical protein ACNR90_004745 [Candidozyma auris]
MNLQVQGGAAQKSATESAKNYPKELKSNIPAVDNQKFTQEASAAVIVPLESYDREPDLTHESEEAQVGDVSNLRGSSLKPEYFGAKSYQSNIKIKRVRQAPRV